ncbi:MAG: hypothetical protein V1886_01135 [archaeon]
MMRENFLNRKRSSGKCEGIVIKLGTVSITTPDNGINKEIIQKIAKSCSYLVDIGKRVSIVSSGAIACGKGKVKDYYSEQDERLASIGQPILMQAYIEAFSNYNRNVGQILLTDADFDSRKRLELLRKTFKSLQDNNEIPIINENDAIATDEITFWDNDLLAANLTVDLKQDLLLILTVYDGLMDKNRDIAETGYSLKQENYADLSSEIVRKGSGGLESKLNAAKICRDNCKICRIGNVNRDIIGILEGKEISTTFYY